MKITAIVLVLITFIAAAFMGGGIAGMLSKLTSPLSIFLLLTALVCHLIGKHKAGKATKAAQ